MPPSGPAGSSRPVFAPPQLPAPLTTQPGPRPVFGAQPPAPPSASGPDSDGRSNAIWWLLGVGVVIAAIVAFLFLRSGSDDVAAEADVRDQTSQPSTDRDDDPDSGAETVPEQGVDEPQDEAAPGGGAVLSDPIRPDSVAVDGSSVWVSDAACGVVLQVDKSTEEVLGSVNVGGSASGVAVAAGSVWVGTREQGTVVQINTSNMSIGRTVQVPGLALGVSASGNELWVTDSLIGVVHRIDAAEGQLAETVQVGLSPHNVAIGDRSVWVTNQGDDTVTIIPKTRGRSAFEVAVGGSPLHVALGAGSAWVTDSSDGAVSRLNEDTGEVEAVIDVGAWPHALDFANGAVWVGTETGSFWRIDPANNDATRVDDATFASIDTAVDGTDLWVADASGGSVVRFDTASGTVGTVIDLNEFGDCQTFRDEAFDPQPAPDVSLW